MPRVVRRREVHHGTGLGNAPNFAQQVRDRLYVFDDVRRVNRIEADVDERQRSLIDVRDDVDARYWKQIDSDCARCLVAPARDIENAG